MIFDPVLDVFRGKAVTIPPLDGAFRPNTALDDAPILARLPQPDTLALWQGRVVVSSGATLRTFDGAVLQSFGSDISALAVSPNGALAVGLEDGSLRVADESQTLPAEVRCITALAYGEDGRLWLANGSTSLRPSQWATDLMMKNASGSVWVHDGAWRKVASGLAWPYGLWPQGGTAIVSESWRHRLLRLGQGRPEPVLEGLPGYPARIVAAEGGGVWLALFAPPQPLDRVRFAGNPLPPCDDGRGAARLLDRTRPVLWPQFSGAFAMRRHPDAEGAQTLVADALIRIGGTIGR